MIFISVFSPIRGKPLLVFPFRVFLYYLVLWCIRCYNFNTHNGDIYNPKQKHEFSHPTRLWKSTQKFFSLCRYRWLSSLKNCSFSYKKFPFFSPNKPNDDFPPFSYHIVSSYYQPDEWMIPNNRNVLRASL